MSFLFLRQTLQYFCLPVFFALAGGLQPAAGQFYMNQDISLSGIEAVLLVVEFSGNTDTIEGLNSQELERAASSQLQTAGLGMLSERNWARTPGQPYLHLHVNSLDSGLGFVVYRIEAALYQEVQLLRAPDTSSIVATWETSELGFAGTNRLESLQADMLRLVERFTQAHSQANSAE
ncbi:MAG: hypothetical protein ACOC2C_01665 [Cyclonatronaceae bacterium]